jgi:hypothetical protein
MNDRDVLGRIGELVEEEHRLLERRSSGELAADGHAQLDEIQAKLDQCWDLLRQRRARREFGQDPDGAQVRSETVVERFEQ